MEVHHRNVQLALGALHLTEGAPAHQQAGHEKERIHAERAVLHQHRVGCLHPRIELVPIDVWQVVEGHVAVAKHHPHHAEASQTVQAVDHVWIVYLFDRENLWRIV